MKTKYVIGFVIIFTFILAGYFISLQSGDYHPNWKHDDIFETKKIGEDISVAIIKYHNANKRFPEVLDKLTPEYLDQIHNPKVGIKRWEYDEYDKNMDGVSIFVEGVDAELEPIMILTVRRNKNGDLITEWIFDSK